jgi:hypothetical protein
MLQEMGRLIQELIMHELDVITESDWFRELVEESVKKIIEEGRESK